MKVRRTVAIAAFFTAAAFLPAQSPKEILGNFPDEIWRGHSVNVGIPGSFSVGFTSPFDNSSERIAAILRLPHLGLERNTWNAGFEFSPFSVYHWRAADGEQHGTASFLNILLYWNPFTRTLNDNSGVVRLFAGPFVSGSYFFADGGVLWDEYMFTVGVRGGSRAEARFFNMHVASVEAGIRFSSKGKSHLFIGVTAHEVWQK